MKGVDINVDIGEGFPHDEALLAFATTANICCGEHAGSWDLTLETIEVCRRKGVRIGIHPGFPDRQHMGRRTLRGEDLESAAESIREQIGRFLAVQPAAYIKPHGAWYNGIVSDEPGYRAILETVRAEVNLPVMMLPDVIAGDVISEGFADRRYTPEGALVPRSEASAILKDPVEISAQVIRLAGEVDSICIHGDTEDCLSIAELVANTLQDMRQAY